jgi:hypothetical protein
MDPVQKKSAIVARRGASSTANGASSLLATLLIAASLITFGSVKSQTSDNYPAKTIRAVVPFAAGGAVDASARVMADELTKRLGEQECSLSDAGPFLHLACGGKNVSRCLPRKRSQDETGQSAHSSRRDRA